MAICRRRSSIADTNHRDHDHPPVVRYPDPRLAFPAQPVTAFDGALRELARDLLETMHAAPGIGITAPHIGVALRVVVLDLDPMRVRGPMSIRRVFGRRPR